jgi:hypothetical protein
VSAFISPYERKRGGFALLGYVSTRTLTAEVKEKGPTKHPCDLLWKRKGACRVHDTVLNHHGSYGDLLWPIHPHNLISRPEKAQTNYDPSIFAMRTIFVPPVAVLDGEPRSGLKNFDGASNSLCALLLSACRHVEVLMPARGSSLVVAYVHY